MDILLGRNICIHKFLATLIKDKTENWPRSKIIFFFSVGDHVGGRGRRKTVGVHNMYDVIHGRQDFQFAHHF